MVSRNSNSGIQEGRKLGKIETWRPLEVFAPFTVIVSDGQYDLGQTDGLSRPQCISKKQLPHRAVVIIKYVMA